MVAESSLGINYTTISSGYFNAGFLLINIDEWNLNTFRQKLLKCCVTQIG